jgi:hypothetical protein
MIFFIMLENDGYMCGIHDFRGIYCEIGEGGSLHCGLDPRDSDPRMNLTFIPKLQFEVWFLKWGGVFLVSLNQQDLA